MFVVIATQAYDSTIVHGVSKIVVKSVNGPLQAAFMF
jgi:hypothetical protein